MICKYWARLSQFYTFISRKTCRVGHADSETEFVILTELFFHCEYDLLKVKNIEITFTDLLSRWLRIWICNFDWNIFSLRIRPFKNQKYWTVHFWIEFPSWFQSWSWNVYRNLSLPWKWSFSCYKCLRSGFTH